MSLRKQRKTPSLRDGSDLGHALGNKKRFLARNKKEANKAKRNAEANKRQRQNAAKKKGGVTLGRSKFFGPR